MWLKPQEVTVGKRNVAGVDLPVFEGVEFSSCEYNLFYEPFWLDVAIAAFQDLVQLREEIAIMEKGLYLLRHELRITTQRLNLFEKVKIPESEEAIRVIKIYISKIAKKKIEMMEFAGVLL